MPLPIAVFLIVAAVVYGLGKILTRSDKNRADNVLAAGRRRPLVFGPLTGALAGILPLSSKAKKKTVQDLQKAGHYHRAAFEEFASLRNVFTVGWVVLIGTLIVVSPNLSRPAELRLFLAGIFGGLLFYSVPRLILHAKASARTRRIEYGLPDALDMISMCMTGGLPLEHALSRVGKEINDTHPDLACELRIVGRQIDAGSFSRAVDQFSRRIDTPDVRSLAAMVNQTDSQGASVSYAFQEFADGVRLARRQRAEEHANKTTVKMLLPVVFCLAPPVYMMLLSPAVIELRAFVKQENTPGGVLSPETFSEADENDVMDRFSGFSFGEQVDEEG